MVEEPTRERVISICISRQGRNPLATNQPTFQSSYAASPSPMPGRRKSLGTRSGTPTKPEFSPPSALIAGAPGLWYCYPLTDAKECF